MRGGKEASAAGARSGMASEREGEPHNKSSSQRFRESCYRSISVRIAGLSVTRLILLELMFEYLSFVAGGGPFGAVVRFPHGPRLSRHRDRRQQLEQCGRGDPPRDQSSHPDVAQSRLVRGHRDPRGSTGRPADLLPGRDEGRVPARGGLTSGSAACSERWNRERRRVVHRELDQIRVPEPGCPYLRDGGWLRQR